MHIRVGEAIVPQGMSTLHPGASHFVYGVSPAMRAIERVIVDIAPTDIPVLLVGESGTGKEVVALEIHRRSRRQHEVFLKYNCASLSSDTPAIYPFGGENANGLDGSISGTIFLDELSQLTAAHQCQLLQSLPDGEWASGRGLGARLISSTTRNLEDEMRHGRFREELYYRLSGVCLRLPALRQRREDIPVLLEIFIKKYAALFGRPAPEVAPAAMDLLQQHSWPGNVRELENFARKMVALEDAELALSDFLVTAKAAEGANGTAPRLPSPTGRNGLLSLKEASREASRKAERDLILKALERTHWNRKRTARDLQISYKALLYKLKQLGLADVNDAEATVGDAR